MDATDDGRLDAARYPLRFTSRVLFADMDGFRHLNGGAAGRFLEEGRAQFNIAIFGEAILVDPDPGLQLLFVEVRTRYVAQAHYPGELLVATGCAHVGTSSYRLAQAAFQAGRCVALCDTTTVKAREGRPEALGPGERRKMLALRMVDAE